MMLAIIDLGPMGSFISGVVAALTLLGGAMYWAIRSVVGIATKDYVRRHIERKVVPLEDRVNRVAVETEENGDDLRALRDLLEGGNSQFEKGMMDFLDDNINRTVEIQADLDEIKVGLRQLRDEVEETSGESD